MTGAMNPYAVRVDRMLEYRDRRGTDTPSGWAG